MIDKMFLVIVMSLFKRFHDPDDRIVILYAQKKGTVLHSVFSNTRADKARALCATAATVEPQSDDSWANDIDPSSVN